MTELRFVTADVFTEKPFCGNPVAVFPECPPIDDGSMQSIAQELNLSETVFVLPPKDPRFTRSVRIFTPAREVPFAGHPTVGCAVVLAAKGLLGPIADGIKILLDEKAGPVLVAIERQGSRFRAAFRAPRPPEVISGAPNREVAAGMLGLGTGDLFEGAAPQYISAGLGFLFAPVRNRTVLARAALDLSLWSRVMAKGPVQEVYVFTMEDWTTGRAAWTRMFAPGAGIVEDPATGSAAAAAARFLFDLQGPPDGEHEFVLHQGIEMGRPSLIHLKVGVEQGVLRWSQVGGEAILMSEGVFFGGLPGRYVH